MEEFFIFFVMFVFAASGFGKMEKVKPKLKKSVLDTLKVDGSEIAIITMESGEKIYMKFWPEDAPNTVKNFIMLSNLGFYDSLTFHRVVPDFVVQGGDPLGNGTGGPGYTINAEFNERPHLTGTVAMARSQDPNSAGSQFYICLSPQPGLDRKYTVFGQVIRGMDVVNRIKGAGTGDLMRGKGELMQSVMIERRSYDELKLLCKGMAESVIYKPPEAKSIALPGYPEELLSKGIEGKVCLRILINKKGEVVEVKIVGSEIPEINEEALITIAKTWVFTPAKVTGIPILDWITVVMEFRIRSENKAEVKAAGEIKVIEK